MLDADAGVDIRLLGEPAIRVDGREASLRSARIPALLGYLVAHPRRPSSRATLAEALWPGREPEQAGQNLRQTLVRLRQSLGAYADDVVWADRNQLRLLPNGATVDVDDFRRAVAEGDLRRAIDLYPGPFLAGLDDEWALPFRAELSRSYIHALLGNSESLLKSDPAQALALAERAAAEEPFHEAARAGTIRALRAMGEEAMALRAYEAYETLLADELGLRPTRIVEEALTEKTRPKPTPREAPKSVALDEAIRTLDESGRTGDALRLAVSTTAYWAESGWFETGLRTLERARERHATLAGEPRLAAEAALAVAALASRAGEFERALREAGRAFALADEDLLRAQAKATMARANVRKRSSTEARRLALEALRLVRRGGGAAATECEAWLCVAYGHRFDGTTRRILPAARRAQASAGDPRAYSLTCFLLASAYLLAGETEEARRHLADALKSVETDRGPMAAGIRGGIARISEEIGDVGLAESGYLFAIGEYRRTGDPYGLPIVLTYLGDLRTAQSDPQAAIALHEEALAIRRRTDDRLGEATSHRGLGTAKLAVGSTLEARTSLREAVRQYSEIEFLPGLAGSLLPLARAEREVGSPDVARRLLQRAIRLLRDMSPAVRTHIGPRSERLLPEAEALLGEWSV